MSELTSISEPRWFQQRGGSPLRLVAYFSPEFGISETLPQYSGGLGVLAGDILKEASDLAYPFVGVASAMSSALGCAGLGFFSAGFFLISLAVFVVARSTCLSVS